jgi:hypothetical protein
VRIALAATIILGFAGTALPAPASPPTAIPFATYGSPYFVRNDFQPGLPRSYAVMRSLRAFQAAFGVGRTMNGPKATIDDATFRTKMLLVAIERGPLCTFTAAKVTSSTGSIRLEYSLQCPARGSASFAVPLIIAVERSASAVSFVENGRTIDVVRGLSVRAAESCYARAMRAANCSQVSSSPRVLASRGHQSTPPRLIRSSPNFSPSAKTS